MAIGGELVNKMRRLSTVLIIAGILILLIPVAGRIYARYDENKLISEWLSGSIDEETFSENASDSNIDPEEAYIGLQDSFENGFISRIFNNDESRETSEDNGEEAGDEQDEEASEVTTANTEAAPSAAVAPSKPSAKQTVLGLIIIDKIKIKYPIVEGVREENLRVGIGHIPGTAGLGQPGNCALAGHRNYTFGRFFNRLDELEEGDKITISTKGADYRYIVYEKFVVKPDDVSVLKGSKDEHIITLITCTPIYIASHRLIVRARLESQTAAEP